MSKAVASASHFTIMATSIFTAIHSSECFIIIVLAQRWSSCGWSRGPDMRKAPPKVGALHANHELYLLHPFAEGVSTHRYRRRRRRRTAHHPFADTLAMSRSVINPKTHPLIRSPGTFP